MEFYIYSVCFGEEPIKVLVAHTERDCDHSVFLENRDHLAKL